MLELQKITGLEKPNKLDKFKKVIEPKKEIQDLDFFKVSRLQQPKSIVSKILDNFIPITFLFLSSTLAYGMFSDSERKKIHSFHVEKNNKIYEQLSIELERSNTVNVHLFNELKSSPTMHGDYFSNLIVKKILDNGKVPLKVKNEIFNSYAQNWDSGTKQVKKYYENCGINFICHDHANNVDGKIKQFEPEFKKTIAFTKYPDMYKKYMELEKLKEQHKVIYKD